MPVKSKRDKVLFLLAIPIVGVPCCLLVFAEGIVTKLVGGP